MCKFTELEKERVAKIQQCVWKEQTPVLPDISTKK